MNWVTQNLAIILVMVLTNENVAMTTSKYSYVMGAVIALFIIGYLIYSLVRPDKF